MASNYQILTSLKPVFLHILEENIIKFWTTHSLDMENGGFAGQINDRNQPVAEASKGVVLNTRILWTYSACSLFFKSMEYRQIADRAYKYISGYFIDKQYGGVYWELDFKANPLNRRKQVYAQAFGIYSFSEYYKISPKKEVLEKAVQLYNLIEKYSLDRKNGGYQEAFGEDWSEIKDLRLSEKEINAPKTMNTHLHILEAYTNLYRVWKDEGLRLSIEKLILLFLEKFIDQRSHLVLFFDNNWRARADFYSFGHDIEFSWLLHEAAKIIEQPELISRTGELSVRIADLTLNEAIDNDGGLFYEFDFKKNLLDTDKHWWPQAEAMVGFFKAYQNTQNERYLETVIGLWNFIDKKIIDHKYGEWYWKVDKNGSVYPGMEKSGFWKCPYHNSRAMLELLNGIP